MVQPSMLMLMNDQFTFFGMHCCSMVYCFTAYKINFHELRDFTKTYSIQGTHFPSLFHLHFKQVQTSFCVVHKTDTGDDQVRDSTAYQEGICWIQQSLRTSCGFKTQMLTFSSFESPSAFPL